MRLSQFAIVLFAALSAWAQTGRSVRSCATCHPAQAKPHPETSMAHALESVTECDILKKHAVLTYQSGGYSYRIERQGDMSIYTVSDATETITVPIEWAFGLGFVGQTYVYEKDGEMYQSRVSFYRALDGLDWTLGATNAHPLNLTDAAGQLMDRGEKTACFACHATDAVENKQLSLKTMSAGVQCERCHGPTAHHLEGIQKGDAALAKMEDLRTYSAEQTSNFCGQCHRTWDQVAMSGIHGVFNVRFQPYRLTNSRCYDADDDRIRCTACHDPHGELNRVDASYDSKCLACHAGGNLKVGAKAKGKACPVSKNNCVGCHMAKIEIPGSHHTFTDHDIRIVKANEPFPD